MFVLWYRVFRPWGVFSQIGSIDSGKIIFEIDRELAGGLNIQAILEKLLPFLLERTNESAPHSFMVAISSRLS